MTAQVIDHPRKRMVHPDMEFVWRTIDGTEPEELFNLGRYGMNAATAVMDNEDMPTRQKSERIVTAWALSAFALLRLLGIGKDDIHGTEPAA